MRFYRIQEGEFLVCMAATLGVVGLGALPGIGLSIGLAMLVLLIRSSRPADAVLGRVGGLRGFHDLEHHEGATAVPGLVIYRFTASLIFYNAPYFRRRVLSVVTANPAATWLVVDAGPIAFLDSTGADTLASLVDDLSARGVRIALGSVVPQVRRMLERSGALDRLGVDAVFPSLRAAVEACEARERVSTPAS